MGEMRTGRAKMKRLYLIIATFTAIAILSSAQASEKTDDIQKLMSLTGVSKLIDQNIAMIVPQIINLMRTSNPKIPKKFLREMEKDIIAEFRRSQPEYLGPVLHLYSSRFTHQEIKDLISFYESPTGRKIIRVMPTFMKELAAIAQTWGKAVGARAADQMIKRMEKRGY